MKTREDYIAEDFTATIPVAEYMANYRDAEKFIGFCRQCTRYNTYWACPPDVISFGKEMMETERKRTDELLLEMEKTYKGRAFFPGSCLLCPTCTRTEGKPCLYPERVRPSLEACGFDIGKTASELLHIELKWGDKNRMPEYLLLVSGIFGDIQKDL